MPKTTIPYTEPAAKILPRTIHDLGPAFEHRYDCNRVLCHWPDIVGPAIAHSVEAVRIIRETLWLYTYDASWRNQIAYMQAQIIEKVNQYACQMLVKELRFARAGSELKWLRRAPMDEGVDYAKLLPKVNLTDEEVAAIREQCAQIESEALRASCFRVSLKQAKREKLQRSLGYHKCQDCNTLCEPQAKRCPSCALKHRQAIRIAIRRYLGDIPWARYAEVKNEIPEATPETLASVRATYIRELSSEVLLSEPDSMKAKVLTMAFRCVPPEQLSEELIRRTLWYLRKDLAQPEEWKAVRRYDYIPWGKKKQ